EKWREAVDSMLFMENQLQGCMSHMEQMASMQLVHVSNTLTQSSSSIKDWLQDIMYPALELQHHADAREQLKYTNREMANMRSTITWQEDMLKTHQRAHELRKQTYEQLTKETRMLKDSDVEKIGCGT
ncbi:hypothetical protein GOP47_0026105, partial [Adiantum capillus-veneris]